MRILSQSGAMPSAEVMIVYVFHGNRAGTESGDKDGARGSSEARRFCVRKNDSTEVETPTFLIGAKDHDRLSRASWTQSQIPARDKRARRNASIARYAMRTAASAREAA
jgi:hypothetical protein